jgi:hypothetical protein
MQPSYDNARSAPLRRFWLAPDFLVSGWRRPQEMTNDSGAALLRLPA